MPTWRKTIFMSKFLNKELHSKRNSNHKSNLSYLIFGIAVIVTLMLNVCSTQDLQISIGLSQVLHCCGHVQGVDPAKGANGKMKPNNVKHLIMKFPCCYVWLHKICHLAVRIKSNRVATVIIQRWFVFCWISSKWYGGLQIHSANRTLWDVWNVRPETERQHPKPVLPLWSHLPIHSS